MIEGLGGSLADDDSDSDANYDYFHDSDYDLSDEDDRIYEENVDANSEWVGSRNARTVSPVAPRKRIEETSDFFMHAPIDEGDDSLGESDDAEYEDSEDGFLSGSDGEGDPKVKKPIVFRPIKGRDESVFCEGMIFKHRAQFAGAIRHHSILQEREIRFTKNETTRVRAKCKVVIDPEDGTKKFECPWTIFASDIGKDKTLQVKTYVPKHTCGRIWRNKLINSSWVAMMYFDDIRITPTLKVSELVEKVKSNFKCNVSVNQCYRARQKVLKKLEGNIAKQYAMLWDYCHEIDRTNPGTSVYIHLKHDLDGMPTNVFQRFYICLAALKKGFKDACRPILGVDGCHLKGYYPGQLLTAVGIDANDQTFPVAYAVVEIENTETWTWFLNHLIPDLQIENEPTWTIISDKQKAILLARDKPILTMLEKLGTYFMKRLVDKRAFATKWVDELGPKIHDKIEKIKSRYGDYIVILCGEGEFEARHIHTGYQNTINLQRHTCSCRRWDLTGIPCEHAARVIVESGGQPDEFVSKWYSKHSFLTAYGNIMHPMNGSDMWEKSGKDPIKPPDFKRQPGRLCKARRREADESAKKPFKLSKIGVKMTCRRCGIQGHNTRTCKAPMDAVSASSRGRGRGRGRNPTPT
ncbi:hypothetical protein RHMOL_Rhmol07G0125100 [Rhododendron molle]|uniref:Uncharacterized protein n=1 Tax=Rhododendron molle TaxID=49168 RepID=A0ACC0N0L8_RHOML|nr:hypothetical protein RHMOL_Rhmol07G0125100 [Rhododendron molle]